MNGKGFEPFEYRSETEIIMYPEYNVLNEELGHAPEYDESSKILSAQAGTKLPLLHNLIVSAFKGGGAVVCALLLAGAVAANHGDMGDTAKQAAQIVETGQRLAVSQKPGLSPDDFHALWIGDPDGPHDFDLESPFFYQEASCTKDGAAEFVCLECGAVKRLPIPATGHDPKEPLHENEIAASCSVEGSYDEVVYCGVCGEELSREVAKIPAAGHEADAPVKEEIVAANCAREGSYDEVVYCSVCHEELSRTHQTTAKTAHIRAAAVTENLHEAGCMAAGSRDDVVYCSVCHQELSRTTVALPATGHSAGAPQQENGADATCTAEGHHDEVVYCSRCGTELSRETVTTEAALGHVAGPAQRENIRTASCTRTGGYDLVTYCARCGEELSREVYRTEPLGHLEGEPEFIEMPIDDAGGIYIVVYCRRCGKELYREPLY